MQRYTSTVDCKIVSIAVVRDLALLLHGEADPMTGLRARATSAVSVAAEKKRWGWAFAVSGQTNEVSAVLACDAALVLTGVHLQYST